MTVKEQRDIETNELTGYILDGMSVPLDKGNRHYKDIQEWIAQGNTPEPAYTEQERFEYLKNKKVEEIKSSFNQAVNAGYACSNGITMNSNIDDIDKLQKGYDLAIKNGLSTMDIRDYNNATHTGIALSDVDTMLLELGNNYAALLKHKWDLVDSVNAATTQADLDAITW